MRISSYRSSAAAIWKTSIGHTAIAPCATPQERSAARSWSALKPPIGLARHQSQRDKERLADLFQQAPAFFAVLRGPEHIFEMINPPYQELIGQRNVLGKTVREAVPEAAEQGFIALLDEVYRTGQPFVGRGTPIELARSASQFLEVRYLDFVYQPRREQDGTISGIIVLGVDVTESKRRAGSPAI